TFRHKKTEDALAKKYGIKSGRGGFTGQSSGIGRFRAGLGEQLFPPLEAFMVSFQGIVSRARLNETARQIIKYAHGAQGSRWITTIPRPMDAQKISGAALRRDASCAVEYNAATGLGKRFRRPAGEGGNFYNNLLAKSSTRLTSALLSSLAHGAVSYREAAQLLNIKVNQLEKLRENLQ
ncbi:MAG: hypothetical protein IIB87_04395, partial [Chloroflexi bacterium]|nr:hypothetical protein [Chloroflexota bacterium]